jgi:hypothetical protein
LLICHLFNGSFSSSIIFHSLVTTSILFNTGIESVKEGLEMNIFSLLTETSDTGIRGLTLLLDKVFRNFHSGFLLFKVGMCANPNIDDFVELQDESVIGVEVISTKRSLCDLSHLQSA